MDISDFYIQEIHEKFGSFASWPPQAIVALGDVGKINKREFKKLTTLNQLGVSFEVEKPSPPADQQYMTGDQVQVSMSGKPASRLNVSFGQVGATFFQAVDCVLERMGNLLSVQEAVRVLYREGTWKREWVLVTEVMRTGPAAILVSGEKSASVEFGLPSEALGAPMSLANGAGLALVHSLSGLAVKHVTTEGTTPWFGLARLRRRVLGPDELQYMSGGSGGPVLTSVTWDEFVAETSA